MQKSLKIIEITKIKLELYCNMILYVYVQVYTCKCNVNSEISRCGTDMKIA